MKIQCVGLAIACLAGTAGAASAGPSGDPTSQRGVVRTVQFFPANLSLGTAQREAISKTGRTLMSPRHAGCKAPCLRLDPGTRITVVGHAFHPRSKEEDAMMVSHMRAGLVRQVLVEAGVPDDRIWMAACGDSAPTNGMNDERVEIIVAPDSREITCG
jgi:hypothetical protein